MPSVPGGQAGSSNVSLTTSGSCWNPDSSNTLTITSSMLDNVHAKYPSQPACYGDKVFFKKFPGYVTTQAGPEWSREELDELAEEIINPYETK